MSENRGYVGARALMEMGFPARSAAVLAGNIQQESSWRSGAQESGGTGAGLVQWSYGRRNQIYDKFGGKLPDAPTQLQYMYEEMRDKYGDAYKVFKDPNASDEQLWGAAKRYWGWGEEGNRRQYAKEIQSQLASDGNILPNNQYTNVGAPGNLMQRPVAMPVQNDFSQGFQSQMMGRLTSDMQQQFRNNTGVMIDGEKYGRAVKDGQDVLVKWGSVAGTGGSGSPIQSRAITNTGVNSGVQVMPNPNRGNYTLYKEHWQDFSPTTKDGKFGALDYTIIGKDGNDKVEKLAPFSGKVTFAGKADGYGNLVEVETDGGIRFSVGHVSGLRVKPGDIVQAGQPLAVQDTTGNSTGVHTHLELRRNGQLIGGQELSDFGKAYLGDIYGITV